MSQVPLRHVIKGYIGGGWGKEAPDLVHTVPASVIRGTDLDAVQSGVTDGVPYRWHKASNARSRTLEDGDIVFEVSGGSKDQPVGRSLLLDDARLAMFQGSVIPASFCKRITPNQTSIYPRFLLAHLQLAWADRRIVQWQVQSTGISNFNFEAFLDDFVIGLPPLPIQRRIAGILSAYDELIENSQRRIKILELMARALYREWFVHFRFPGHESTPRIPTPIGEIPKGWEVKTIRQVAGLVSRGPSLSYVDSGGVQVVNQRCIRNEEIEMQAVQCAAPLSAKKSHLYLQPLDVLINSMGVGTLGRVSRNLSIDEPTIIHNCITVVRARTGEPTTVFLYYRLSDCQEHFEGLGVGATGQTSLRIETIEEVPFALPPFELLTRFEQVALPMWTQVGVLKREIRNLRRTRDLLLPRLLSGQIDVEAINP
jgi:type I restriction enzyme S subunit